MRGMVFTLPKSAEFAFLRQAPSCLIYGHHGSVVFHVLFAADVKNKNVRVVTAYLPDSKKWDNDLKERKKP